MAEYSGAKCVELYEKALMELGHAKVRGRIGDARAQIIARVEKLKSIPSLHAREDRAIENALTALRFLEREEERYDENQKTSDARRLETAMRKLPLDDSASD
jgi:hypothetical protein